MFPYLEFFSIVNLFMNLILISFFNYHSLIINIILFFISNYYFIEINLKFISNVIITII